MTQNKLPVSFDVTVSLQKGLTAVGTDMTLMAFCTPNVDFLHGERVKTYLTADAFNKICTPGDQVWWAGNAFFSKTKRPSRIAVGKIFTEDQPAYLLSGGCDYQSLASISNGSFAITVAGTAESVTGLNFSSVASLSDVAEVISTAISSFATCELHNGNLVIKSVATGNSATISYALPIEPASGTDVSSLLGLTEAAGASFKDGYTHGSAAAEMQAIADYAIAAGFFIYGWAVDYDYRDTADQREIANWVNGRSFRAVGAFVTNNASAYNPDVTTNNGLIATEAGLNAVSYLYDDNSQVYPDVSYLATFLAVNYNNADSSISGKFKDAENIPAVNFPDIETNVSTLNSRRINTITGVIGQNAKYFREGVQSSSLWSTDGWVNICNFIAELEIEILNVFLRNNKVAYTTNGQNLLIAAASKICNKYKVNGSFADRLEEDATSDTGFRLVPACQIDIQELSATTASQRAAHIGTPMTITVNDAGWMGSIAIDVVVTE